MDIDKGMRMDKIAVLGPKGTFCDNAYMEFDRVCKGTVGRGFAPEYCATIDEVFECVSNRTCEWGIAPIENTLDGYVQRTLDLLLEKDVHIVAENMVSVQFSLIGNVNSVEEIEQLYVQFKANGQCRNFINSLRNVAIITTESNMESYYRIGDAQGLAAIVPRHIAMQERDNMEQLVIENVTDATNNHTRFVIFKLGETDRTICCRESEKVRIPAYIMPKTDRPGILYEILRNFYEKHINLISIMSRPTKQELGTYNFYVEIEGRSEDLDVIFETLDNISKGNDIKILGVYGE